MHFSASVLLASLAAMANAAPTSPAPISALEKRDNNCGASTFVNASSAASPLISDCQQLAANIVGNGSWFLYWEHQTILTYGTCAFGARANTAGPRIGNEDVRDLIYDSINKFSWQGKVGSSGSMKCGDNDVVWGLYHT